MNRKALQLLLYGLGCAALVIGGGIYVLGPATIAGFFADPLPDLVPGLFGTKPDGWPRDADNEMRFYAVFWFAYGACLVAAARNPESWAGRLPILLALFFAGGTGRLIAVIQNGWPHPLFVLLMWIELIMPMIMYALYRTANIPQTGGIK